MSREETAIHPPVTEPQERSTREKGNAATEDLRRTSYGSRVCFAFDLPCRSSRSDVEDERGTRNNLKGIFSIRILSEKRGSSAVPSDGLPAVSGGAGAVPSIS